jgi:hypothetical protein
VAVDFVHSRLKQFTALVRIRSHNFFGGHHPDAHSFLTAGVHIPGIFDGHTGIGCMDTSGMAMVKTCLTPDKNFPNGPFLFHIGISLNGFF